MKEGAKGFDISHHQDVTYPEFVGAKQNGYEFVVIRATHGTDSVDTKFKRHYDAANKAGFVVFAYFFMYYADKEKSAREVANCLRTVKGLDLACVFLDMENRGEYFRGQHLSMLSKAEATERMLYAISEIEKAGLKAGLYADVDWMKNEIDMSRVPESVLIWAADWHGKLDYKGRCEMRQYTSVGTIAGIGTGSVDLNELLVDYPESAISASAHIQNLGWQDGEQTIGTVGQSLRLEAVKIDLPGIEYRAHVQDLGWLDWVASGQVAGTTGESRRMEAIQITGPVQYRAHVQDIGWMDWVNSGETAGTVGQSKRLEAIEIKML